jgi:hypothetical protein
MHLAHHLIEAVLGLDELVQAGARGGELAQEAGVDGLVDTEREHAGLAQRRRDLAQDLILVADPTIAST